MEPTTPDDAINGGWSRQQLERMARGVGVAAGSIWWQDEQAQQLAPCVARACHAHRLKSTPGVVPALERWRSRPTADAVPPLSRSYPGRRVRRDPPGYLHARIFEEGAGGDQGASRSGVQKLRHHVLPTGRVPA